MEDMQVEIDLLKPFQKYAILMVVFAVVFGVVAFLGSYLLPNEYTATSEMYVLLNDEKYSSANSTDTITQTDLNTAQMVASDVATIMVSNRVKRDTATELGLANLNEYKISVADVSSTRLLKVSVTAKDPQEAADVCNTLVRIASNIAVDLMGVQSVNVIEEALVPTSPSGPPHLRIAAVAAMLGFLLVYGNAIIGQILDTSIHNDEELSRVVDVPILGHFAWVQR